MKAGRQIALSTMSYCRVFRDDCDTNCIVSEISACWFDVGRHGAEPLLTVCVA
jgi:hypothetical protein